MDYIYIWACHNYRPSILQELKILFDHDPHDLPKLIGNGDSTTYPEATGQPPLETTHQSTEGTAFARITQVDENAVFPNEDDDSTFNLEDAVQSLKNLRLAKENLDRSRVTHRLDSEICVIRDAAPIESRFFGVHISGGNLEEYLSEPFGRKSSPESNLLLTLQREPLLVSENTLNAIETAWTGNSREGAFFTSNGSKFLAKISLLYYITPDWRQVRELSYVAISLDAINLIRLRSKDLPIFKVLDSALDVDYDFLLGYCSHLRKSSISFNLQCTLTRLAVNIPQTLEKSCFPFSDGRFDDSASNLVHQLIAASGERSKDFGLTSTLLRISDRQDWQATNTPLKNFPMAISLTGSALLIHDSTSWDKSTPKACLFTIEEYAKDFQESSMASTLEQHLYASAKSSLYLAPCVATGKSIKTWNLDEDIWNIKDEMYYQIITRISSLHPKVSLRFRSLITYWDC
jgi:hypothetical protein